MQIPIVLKIMFKVISLLMQVLLFWTVWALNSSCLNRVWMIRFKVKVLTSMGGFSLYLHGCCQPF